MILVCGEALFDVFVSRETPAGLTLDARLGGSPFNVAVGLARLGQRVGMLGGVANDPFGARIMAALDREGVFTGSVVRVDAPTTLSIVGLDAHGVPTYAFYGDRGADRQVTAQSLAHLPPCDAIHVGSYATVVEPIAGTLRQLVDRARQTSVISYDPNVRLNVEPDVGRWRDQVEWMLTRAHVLKVSADDCERLQPGEDPSGLATRALASGVRLVVVTDGERGARGWTQLGTADTPARAPGSVVDTVGAGDTFMAAVLSWLVDRGALARDRLDLEPAAVAALLEFACLAAGVTCTRRGADLPTRADLTRALAART